MKLHIANYQPDRTGGGWTFCRNLVKGLNNEVYSYDTADVYFIASPSMVQRDDVQRAKADGKKIVLRLDNAVRNSRNRNTGMSRMKDFAEWADLVIYQSDWAKSYLKPYTKKDGPVILNGVDLDIFYPPKTQKIFYEHKYLYSRYNRDETKNWEVARYFFSQVKSPEKELYIVGQFSPELIDSNFDFYMGEKYTYWGVVGQEQMGDLYRSCRNFVYTYFNDCMPNSLIEALCSGCKIVGPKYFLGTGGAPEIIKHFKENGREYFSHTRMAEEYNDAIEAIL